MRIYYVDPDLRIDTFIEAINVGWRMKNLKIQVNLLFWTEYKWKKTKQKQTLKTNKNTLYRVV